MPAAIIPAIASAFVSVGLSAAAAGVLASVVGFVASSALISAASFALNKAFAGSGGGGSAVNSPEVRGNVRQAVPPKRIVYGEVRVGGALFLYEVKPPFLFLGLLLSHRRIDEIIEVAVGEKLAVLDANGDALNTDFISAGVSRLRISFREGDRDQLVDPIVATHFPELGSDFRQRGIATAVCRFNYGANADDFERLWGNVQIPNPFFVVHGAPVYDPRDPTQLLPTDWEDPQNVADAMATWKYSNTAALIQADWLMQPYGLRVPSDRIDWDSVAEAANYDQESIPLKAGGFQARYTIDGVVTLNQDPGEVMEALLTASRASVVQSRGLVRLVSAKPRTPRITLTDSHMLGGFQFRAAAPRRDAINRVRPRFVAPDREFQQADGGLLVDASYLAEDGEILETTVTLPFTSTHARAQRIAKQFIEQSRRGKTLTLVASIDALELDVGDIVRVQSRIAPSIDGVYSVEDFGLSENFDSVQLSLVEYDASIATDWDPQEELDFELPAIAA